MTPQDAVDRPVVTATVALTLLLLGSVVAYANDEIEAVPTRTRTNGTADELGGSSSAGAGLHVPVAAMSAPTTATLPCHAVTSWSDLAAAIDATAVEAAEQIARYENAQDENNHMDHPPSLRPPQPPVLLLCPFDIVHDGTDDDGYDIATPDLTVVCWKGALGGSDDDACTISGTARHFNIAADNVNLAGISIKGSRNGAIVVSDRVQGTTFVGNEFVDNTLESGDGGAISLRLRSSATLFSGCLFSDNFAVNGGAISGDFATATLHSSTMHFNEATGNGGGVHMQGSQPYMFSVSHSSFLYNAASDGEGPAIWSDGVPCGSGSNYACNNVDWTTNVPCDGIFKANGGVCEVFDNNCHAGVDADERAGGDATENENLGTDGTAGGVNYEDNISSDRTESPTTTPSASPSVSTLPTLFPSVPPTSNPSMRPSRIPSNIPSESPTQAHSGAPSTSPTTSSPTPNPTQMHSDVPSSSPSTSPPSPSPSEVPTEVHSDVPTAAPSNGPSNAPTISFQPTEAPTTSPTVSPTETPSSRPSGSPSASPTISLAPTRGCHANEVERAQQISDIIIENTETTFQDILNDSSPQHRAFHWLMYEDEVYVCPEDDGIVQRYVIAVFYFATGGDTWTRCGADKAHSSCDEASDEANGEVRFLSAAHECQWYGISCDGVNSITKIAYEKNNLNGQIPDELSSLSSLTTLSLEKMSIRGTIPSSLGSLANLLSLDLDFNDLTGTIPPELGNIHGLKLLDLNDNRLSGSIDALAGFHHLLFAQLHHNEFSGPISLDLGDLMELRAVTLFGNDLTGSIPQSLCNNKVENGGTLQHLEVDCGGDSPDVECDCCTQCWTESPTSHPTYSPTPVPTALPTPVASAPPSISAAPTVKCNMDLVSRAVSLQSLLRDVSDPVSMVTEGSAQNRAWKWLLEEDEMFICPNDSNVIQRYVMAVFYHSTLGDAWFSCADNNNTPCPRGADTYQWLTGASECNWFGVDCDINGLVTGVIFDDNDLSGQIPTELSYLNSLEVLKLENGKIGGTIPSSLGNLTNLRELDLDFNLLTGSIPQELSNAVQLQVLDLNNNYDLTGNMTPLSQLTNLQFIQLHHTKITGTIPDELGNLKDLETLSVYATDLEGTIPRSVCRNRNTLGGQLMNLQADCGGFNPEVMCICCSMCFPMRRLTLDTAVVAMQPTAMPVVPPRTLPAP